MTLSIDKAIARSDALATANLERAMQLKAAGELPIASSTDGGGGFGQSQEQMAARRREGDYRNWIYSAVHAKAVAAANQPVNVAIVKGAELREDEERGTPSATKHFLESKMPVSMRTKSAGQELEVIIDHPFIDLLNKPNDVQDRWQFVYSFAASLDLTGWAFLVIDGENPKTKRMDVWSLPTSWVQPLHKDGPFSAFKITNPKDASAEGVVLGRENVAFAYLPDPTNPLSALPPALAQKNAIRIDDHIQTSQERFFENGIFPSMIVTVGKDPHPDGAKEGTRPRLTAPQKRQVLAAIRKQTGLVNYGAPAIVDGLIESFTRLSATQNEMGWEKSEDKVRARILSAYGVHPFMLGEVMNVGGYKQAAVIKEVFCDRVNIPLGMLSQLMTNIAAQRGDGERLKVWWEVCIPVDKELESLNWREARKKGDVTRNENRTRLGLPPDEQAMDRSVLLDLPGGMAGATQILRAMGEQRITPEVAAWMLSVFLEIPIKAVQEQLGSSEDQVVGQVVEGLEEVVRQLGTPLQVKFDSTEIDRTLTKLLSVADDMKKSSENGN